MMRGQTGGLGTIASVALIVVAAVAALWLGGTVGAIDGLELDDAVDDRPSWMLDHRPSMLEAAGDDRDSTDVELTEEQESAVDIERLIHIRVNDVREEHGLEPLDHDAYVADIARSHSADMYEREYFSHYSPEDDSPGDRMGDANLFPGHCQTVGENLAHVSFSGELETTEHADRIAEVIVEGWMDSPGHRENLLAAEWDVHGIGVYGGDGEVYATQNFCEERF